MSKLLDYPVGGRLRHFHRFWSQKTTDSWALEVIEKGYSLPFTSSPPLSGPVETPRPRDPWKLALLEQEVQSLMSKDAVEIVTNGSASEGYYSHYFLAPKKDGSWRPILNLKGLNLHLRCDKFRMETLTSILQCVNHGDWMFSLDLKDAYLHVPILPAHRRYLRFAFRNLTGELIIYQWKVLPFGLSTAPRVFTKLIAPLAGLIHSRGHALFPYIDDMFGNHHIKVQAQAARNVALQILMSAGFVINLAKSVLGLTQDMIHLGARIRSDLGLVTLPQSKVDQLVRVAREMLAQDQVTARQFLRYTGLMTACMPMIPHCLFRTRPLTIHLLDHYKPGVDPLSTMIPLKSTYLTQAILFWTVKTNLEMGIPLGPHAPKIIVSTDASLLGWGGGVSGPNLLGCMVSPRLEEPHKHAGDEGSVVHSAALRDEAAESVSSNINGQHHSDGLPQQRRRHSLQVAKCASQGSDKLVFGPIDAISMRTCAGGRQCTSGCIVATMANATQRQLSQCGVVDGSESSESNIPEVGQAVNRPVCHGAEQEALQVLQPGAPPLGRTNTSDGTALGQKSGVCFPPNGTGNDVHTQNTQRGSGSHSRATLVAEKGLVPHSAGGNSRTSHSASRSSRSVARPTGHGASRPRDPPVNRLEGLRESLKTSGISQEAATTIEAAHRPSTRALYKRKWEVFRVWCDRRHVNPVHPPIRKVINYLQHLLSVPIKVATILTHISALSVCCDPIEGASIGNHPMVKTWVKGSKALNPRIRTLMPAWSLPVILSALREQPYEPMAKADLKHLTLKTTFLLAITSARRISELQALCMAEPFLIINPASAFLRVNNAFLPKVPSDLALNADIELQAFYPNPHTGVEKEQRKNCPIRALNYYLAATKLIRKENLNLFVNFTDKAQGSPASKRVISTWIAEVIRAAYHVMGHTDPLSIRANPHSLRGVATTYAELAAVSPAEICRAATWSKYCMFSKAYRLDSIAKGNFGAAVLKTASQVR